MDFLELSKKRFATRKFSQETISKEDLNYIMESVRMAPSAVNRQPWKFVIVQSGTAKEKLLQCYDREWFRSAPLYIICLKDTMSNWIRPFDNKAHGDIDLAIAIEHLCLAATEQGLGTCWVCNYDPARLSQLFSTPGYEAVAIIPLGHIAPDCPHKEKQRKPLEEITEYI
ncbi:MAG: nitroreductase family protein [Segatella oris]|uniref:nitroreductase family protein n=1 Tax=Prevotellaceae TaxID=171552 RepID=UPI003FA0EBBD